MLSSTKDLVPQFKKISVPSECSFPELRSLIEIAFNLPTELEFRVYLDDKEKTNLVVGNMHRLARTPQLAIEFDAEKWVFRFSSHHTNIFRLSLLRNRQRVKAMLKKYSKRKRRRERGRETSTQSKPAIQPNHGVANTRQSNVGPDLSTLVATAEPQFSPHFPGEFYEEYLVNVTEQVTY